MKLMLKIAGVMFGAILAAAGVYEATHIWELQRRRRMYYGAVGAKGQDVQIALFLKRGCGNAGRHSYPA